jgi:hypothetical protein
MATAFYPRKNSKDTEWQTEPVFVLPSTRLPPSCFLSRENDQDSEWQAETVAVTKFTRLPPSCFLSQENSKVSEWQTENVAVLQFSWLPPSCFLSLEKHKDTETLDKDTRVTDWNCWCTSVMQFTSFLIFIPKDKKNVSRCRCSWSFKAKYFISRVQHIHVTRLCPSADLDESKKAELNCGSKLNRLGKLPEADTNHSGWKNRNRNLSPSTTTTGAQQKPISTPAAVGWPPILPATNMTAPSSFRRPKRTISISQSVGWNQSRHRRRQRWRRRKVGPTSTLLSPSQENNYPATLVLVQRYIFA